MSVSTRSWSSIPSVIRDGSWYLVVNLGSKVSSLFLVIFAARIGGADGLGSFARLTSVSLVVSAACDFGFSTEAMRYVSSSRAKALDMRFIHGIARNRAIFAFILAATASLLLTWNHGARLLTVTSCAAYSSALVVTSISAAVNNGLGRFQSTGILLGVARGASVPLSFALVSAIQSSEILLSSLAICEGLAAFLLWRRLTWRAYRSQNAGSVEGGKSKLDIGSARRFGLSAFINMFVNKSDALLLSTALNLMALGAYSSASQVENALTTLSLVPASALTVHTAREAVQVRRRAALKMTLVAVATLATAGSVVLFATATIWLPMAFGQDLVGAVVTVRITLVGAPLSASAGVLLMALAGTGASSRVLSVWLTAAVLTVPTMYVLAQLLGSEGAAIGSLVRDLTMFVMALVQYRRNEKCGVANA
jgi:O-antigen/teichoic acid export membrane protein